MNVSIELAGCLKKSRTSSMDARRLEKNDEEGLDGAMDPYLVDSDVKIPGSKGFRRLSEKTQVMTSPWNGLVRNRNSHTMEVVGIATTISSILGLNVNLARAISIGHDIGHVPFGHAGEDFLSKKAEKEFNHEVFGVVLAQKVERIGKGLNLTHQTLSGILYHSRGSGALTVNKEMSPEAVVVMYADKFAYITADFNDISKRLRLPSKWIIPIKEKINELGLNQRARVCALIEGLCQDSMRLGFVGFKDSNVSKIFGEVKNLMYGIYSKINIHQEEDALDKVMSYLEELFGKEKAILILALMTDNDVLSLVKKNTFDITDLELTSIWEQIDYILELAPLNIFDPGLKW